MAWPFFLELRIARQEGTRRPLDSWPFLTRIWPPRGREEAPSGYGSFTLRRFPSRRGVPPHRAPLLTSFPFSILPLKRETEPAWPFSLVSLYILLRRCLSCSRLSSKEASLPASPITAPPRSPGSRDFTPHPVGNPETAIVPSSVQRSPLVRLPLG